MQSYFELLPIQGHITDSTFLVLRDKDILILIQKFWGMATTKWHKLIHEGSRRVAVSCVARKKGAQNTIDSSATIINSACRLFNHQITLYSINSPCRQIACSLVTYKIKPLSYGLYNVFIKLFFATEKQELNHEMAVMIGWWKLSIMIILLTKRQYKFTGIFIITILPLSAITVSWATTMKSTLLFPN